MLGIINRYTHGYIHRSTPGVCGTRALHAHDSQQSSLPQIPADAHTHTQTYIKSSRTGTWCVCVCVRARARKRARVCSAEADPQSPCRSPAPPPLSATGLSDRVAARAARPLPAGARPAWPGRCGAAAAATAAAATTTTTTGFSFLLRYFTMLKQQ